MKLLIYSDLHFEHSMFTPDPQVVQSADRVILAGDIYPGPRGAHLIRRVFPDKPILWVPGNHELYGGHWQRTLDLMRHAAVGHDIDLLDDDELEVNGIRFLGATLWTDFDYFGDELRTQAMSAAQECISDYWSIKYGALTWEQLEQPNGIDMSRRGLLQPEHTRLKHLASRHWLEQMLAQGDRDTTVVVSHHFPHQKSCATIYGTDLTTAAFGSRLPEDLITRCKLWIHGHTHNSFDYLVSDGSASTRVLCNPRGYPLSRGGFENPKFNPGLLVEV